MLVAIQRALGIQQDNADIIHAKTTALEILRKLLARVQGEPSSAKAVLQVTYELFHAIKLEPVKTVAFELKLCAQIAGACTEHLSADARHQAFFLRALRMQDFYLRKDRQNRTLLIQYIATHAKYSGNHALVNLLVPAELSSEQRPSPKLTENQPTLTFEDMHLPERQLVSGFLSNSPGELSTRLDRLKERAHSSRKKQAFAELQTDTFDHIKELKEMNPLRGRYNTNDEIFAALFFALEVQFQYISYLRQHKDLFALSKAYNSSACLFRTLHEYASRANMADESKQQFLDMKEFMEKQASNVDNIFTCEHIGKSEVTSAEEKARAQAKKSEYADSQEQGLSALCANYQNMLGGGHVTFLAVPNFTVTLDTYQNLKDELEQIQLSYPNLSFTPLYQKAAFYLHHTMMRLMPQENPPSSYVQYADNAIPGDEINLSQIETMAPTEAARARLDLLNALELYYSTAIAHLDELRYGVMPGSTEDHFLLSARFVSETRLETYRYLLKPQVASNVLRSKSDCEAILEREEYVTPLIRVLAEQKLVHAKAQIAVSTEVQERTLTGMHEPPKTTEAPSGPTNQRSRTAQKKAKQRKKKQEQKVEESSVLTLWQGVQERYEQTSLSAPGWLARKEEVLKSLEAIPPDFEKTKELLDDWIEHAAKQGITDEILINKGLFDGWLNKAVLLRCTGNFTEAMDCVNNAWEHMAPEADDRYKRVRTSQMQRLLIEKGMLYSSQQKLSLAQIAFEEAEKKAQENESLCFYLILLDLQYLVCGPQETLVRNQDLVTRILDTSRTIFIDEYNQAYFYSVCEALTTCMAQVGSDKLKAANAEVAYGRDATALIEEGQKYFDQVTTIHKLLLNFCRKYTPARAVEFEMKLAATYRMLRTLLPKAQRQHLDLANQHLNNVFSLASRTNNQPMLKLLHQERVNLGDALNQKGRLLQKMLREYQQNRYSILRDDCFGTMLNRPLTLRDTASHQEELYTATRKHTILEEVKNIFLVLNKFKPKVATASEAALKREKKREQAFKERLYMISSEELMNIGRQVGCLTSLSQAGLGSTPIVTAVVPQALVDLYAANAHYLAKMEHMQSRKDVEIDLGLGAREAHLEQAIGIQEQVVLQHKACIEAFSPNFNLPTGEAFLAQDIAHICLDMPDTELESIKMMSFVPASLKEALDEKQYWVALHHLFTGLETLTLSARQEAYYHLLIAKIIHWTLGEMSQNLCSKITEPDERTYFEELFATLKLWCVAEYRKARPAVEVVDTVEQEDNPTDQAISAVKALDLSELSSNHLQITPV